MSQLIRDSPRFSAAQEGTKVSKYPSMSTVSVTSEELMDLAAQASIKAAQPESRDELFRDLADVAEAAEGGDNKDKKTKKAKKTRAVLPGKGRKAKKDPNAPKRAMSSFMFYSNEVRGHVSSQNPSMKLTDVSKEIGRRWKEMDSSEKLKYETLAADDKERYKREKSDFDKIGEGEKKKENGAAVEEKRRTDYPPMRVERRAAGGAITPC